jgi:hypothetical protein
MSASEIARILPRAWRARDAPGPASGRAASRSSSRVSRAVAIALFPRAKASSAVSRSEPSPSRGTMRRNWSRQELRALQRLGRVR